MESSRPISKSWKSVMHWQSQEVSNLEICINYSDLISLRVPIRFYHRVTFVLNFFKRQPSIPMTPCWLMLSLCCWCSTCAVHLFRYPGKKHRDAVAWSRSTWIRSTHYDIGQGYPHRSCYDRHQPDSHRICWASWRSQLDLESERVKKVFEMPVKQCAE